MEYDVLIQPKNKGGFGLIFVKAQFLAMCTMFILWRVVDGDLTLQHILRKKIEDLSAVHEGARDFSWIVSKHATKPKGESKVWTNLCKGH